MLNRFPTKPCRFCGDLSHWSYKCRLNPKTKKYIRKEGKHAKQWKVTRATWYRQNPPIPDPFPHYVCYLPNHGEWLRPPDELAGLDNPLRIRVTLDHVLSRSRHPELRAALWVLQPCCPKGNREKGSKDGVLKVK